ncbi:methyltransferase type 12 [Methanoculleus taiwanensis]|uniref:Methyltransferase type 12 n=1 Tax=Methanoculleus taiwanensis TaxID=1550565 RepID=A0A498H4L1_9EURY|nr:methyltransferase domain-containing protein [Methanoculleus taiwanensis]RXE56796.1 methyltransferase type 12 [Methanoculleus taiwanensis]
MNVNDIVTISQGALPIMNPTTPEKLLAAGKAAGWNNASRIIDVGSGNGTTLALWGEAYGISGVGLELRESACGQARGLLAEAGLADRIEVLCTDAAAYISETPFDGASCIGASHIWNGFEPALHAMLDLVHDDGAIIMGDRYWRHDRVPAEFAREWSSVPTEYEILGTARDAGLDLAAVLRASEDDWDRYESGIWQSLLAWLSANPDHPEREEIAGYFRRLQEEYFGYGREYMGWAIYVFVPGIW